MNGVPVIVMKDVCSSTRLHENPLYPENKSNISGADFRETYLSFLDDVDLWEEHKHKSDPFVVLDFSDIIRVGPRFLNEVFAYFKKFGHTDDILKKIRCINIKDIHRTMIEVELDYTWS